MRDKTYLLLIPSFNEFLMAYSLCGQNHLLTYNFCNYFMCIENVCDADPFSTFLLLFLIYMIY